MDIQKRRKTDRDVTSGRFNRFGTVAVQKGLISPEVLKTAMLIQIDDDVNGREHRMLGSILFDRGLISGDQIESIVAELKKIPA